MLMDCKCGANMEAKLDESLDQVICMDCGAEVPVSSFTKTMMKQRRDVMERAEAKIPPNGLKTTCDNPRCNKEFSAEVDKKKDKVFCPFCKSEAKISQIAMNLLKEHSIYVGMTHRYLNEEGKDSDQFLEDVEAEIAPDAKNYEKEFQGSDFAEAQMNRNLPNPLETKKAKGRPKGAKNAPKSPLVKGKSVAKKVIKVGTSETSASEEEIKAVRDQLGSKKDD